MRIVFVFGFNEISKFSTANALSFKLVMVATDLKELFKNGSISATDSPKSAETVPDFRHHYLSHLDINAYLDRLQEKYPHLVTIRTIGYTFEKRALKSIHISTSSMATADERQPKTMKKTTPALNCIRSKSMKKFSVIISKPKKEPTLNRKQIVLIDGGMHAREWCTISTALYCANQLTDNFDANKDLLNAFDFVIVPIVNADGYEYSRHYVRYF